MCGKCDYSWLQLEELEDTNGLCVLLINTMSFYVKIIYIKAVSSYNL
jgi:hypothetical protein